MDACVDGASVTVRDDLQVPVLVRREGEVGDPVRLHEAGEPHRRPCSGSSADAPTAYEILMPGDVVRWPVGLGAAALRVADVDPENDDGDPGRRRGRSLPASGRAARAAQQARSAFAVAIDEIAGGRRGARPRACRARTSCRRRACDVLATTAISRTVTGHLPRATAGGGAAGRPRPPALDAMDATPRPTHLSAVLTRPGRS